MARHDPLANFRFRLEIDKTLALIGRSNVAELDRSILLRRPNSGWEPVTAAPAALEATT